MILFSLLIFWVLLAIAALPYQPGGLSRVLAVLVTLGALIAQLLLADAYGWQTLAGVLCVAWFFMLLITFFGTLGSAPGMVAQQLTLAALLAPLAIAAGGNQGTASSSGAVLIAALVVVLLTWVVGQIGLYTALIWLSGDASGQRKRTSARFNATLGRAEELDIGVFMVLPLYGARRVAAWVVEGIAPVQPNAPYTWRERLGLSALVTAAMGTLLALVQVVASLR